MSSSSSWSRTMERLRSKAATARPLQELGKHVRTAMLERRTPLDAEEKEVLRAALDQLSEAVPVRGASSLADRLEAVARKCGVSFMAVHGCFYLSTEMFFVEINVASEADAKPQNDTCQDEEEDDVNGDGGDDDPGAASSASNRRKPSFVIKEAKIYHIDAAAAANGSSGSAGSASGNASNEKPTFCPEMVDSLNAGDFNRLILHLNGLSAIYSSERLTAPEKSLAWNALTAMEADLESIYNGYRHWSREDAASMILKTPLGLVTPRSGGIPMRMKYFATPLELLVRPGSSQESLIAKLISEEAENGSRIGKSAVLVLEPSPVANLVPTSSLLLADGSKHKMQSFDRALPLGPNNGVSLHVRFALKLEPPLPMELSRCVELEKLCEMSLGKNFEAKEATPLFQLIVANFSEKKLTSAGNRGLFVTLPDQQHCYILTDHPDMRGVLIDTIPFRHPSQVKAILNLLRNQALFNSLVESCVRVDSIRDLEKSIMFEVVASDAASDLILTFELPSGGGDSSLMTSVQFDLSATLDVKSTVFDSYAEMDVHSEARYLDRAIQRCWSLPITMRSIINRFRAKVALKYDKEKAVAGSQSHVVGSDAFPEAKGVERAMDGQDRGLSVGSNSFAAYGCSSMPSASHDEDYTANGVASGQFSGSNKNGSSHHQQQNYSRLGKRQLPDSMADVQKSKYERETVNALDPMMIKEEPMDLDPQHQHHHHHQKPSKDEALNAFGPQDTTFHPGASEPKVLGTTTKVEDLRAELEAAGTTGSTNSKSKRPATNSDETAAAASENAAATAAAAAATKAASTVQTNSSAPSSGVARRKVEHSSHGNDELGLIISAGIGGDDDLMSGRPLPGTTVQKIKGSLSGGGDAAKLAGGKSSSSSSSVGSATASIKPCVSITPVSGSQVSSMSANMLSRPGDLGVGSSPMPLLSVPSSKAGIEIIPLGRYDSSSGGKEAASFSSGRSSKDHVIRRSLSETESIRRKQGTLSSSKGGSSSKKRRHLEPGDSGGGGSQQKRSEDRTGSSSSFSAKKSGSSHSPHHLSAAMIRPSLTISKASSPNPASKPLIGSLGAKDSSLNPGEQSSSAVASGIEIVPTMMMKDSKGFMQVKSSKDFGKPGGSFSGSKHKHGNKTAATSSSLIDSHRKFPKQKLQSSSQSSSSTATSLLQSVTSSSSSPSSASIQQHQKQKSPSPSASSNPSQSPSSTQIGMSSGDSTRAKLGGKTPSSSSHHHHHSHHHSHHHQQQKAQQSSSMSGKNGGSKEKRDKGASQLQQQAQLLQQALNKDSAEEVMRKMLSGGKSLNTTFQIPKRTTPPSSSSTLPASSTLATKGDDLAGKDMLHYHYHPHYQSGGSRSANASPKYQPQLQQQQQQPLFPSSSSSGTRSPKTIGSASSSPRMMVSPKSSSSASSYATPHPGGVSSSPKYVGPSSTIPSPNMSPKHSSSAAPSPVNVASSTLSTSLLPPPNK